VRNFPYWFSDILINLLTFNYLIVKKIIKKEIPGSDKLSIIDLGCGTGTLAKLFNQKKYLGLDIDKGAILRAREKFPGYRFQSGDAVTVKIKNRFDIVLVVGVLHNLRGNEVKKTARKINSLLKKNGQVLIIEATQPVSLFNILGKVLRKLDKGSFVRSVGGYAKLLTTGLTLKKQYYQKGGLLDYAVFVACRQNN